MNSIQEIYDRNTRLNYLNDEELTTKNQCQHHFYWHYASEKENSLYKKALVNFEYDFMLKHVLTKFY